jgi:2-polyprenyl-6-hydroxyphenyl methylase / 3-demethylubiquinone-9 3-methyltransferase
MAEMNNESPCWTEDPDPERALGSYLSDREDPYSRWKSWSVRVLLPRPKRHGLLALDYGCGGGEFAMWLAAREWQVTAADASEHSLAACRLHAQRKGMADKIRFVRNSAPDYWTSFEGRQFDLILAKDVIEHVEDDVSFLKQLKMHLAPSGVAVIVTQNDTCWNYWTQAAEGLAHDPSWCGWDPTHVRFYNLPSLEGKLRYAGLKPVRWRAAYLIPYRAWHSGLRGRVTGLVQKLGATSLFHLPEFALGGVYPVCGWGWSIAVACKHESD